MQYDIYQKFIPPRRVMELLDVSYSTVKRWERENKIKFITKNSGYKLYDVSSIIRKEKISNGQKICYCRVSTNKQSQDLDRQIEFCKKKYPNHQVIKDIGSTLNWRRKGFIALLDRVFQGDIKEVVVTHKDRLCRFGFELVEYIFEKNGVKLVVLNQEIQTKQQELADDIISIVTVFSNRYYGKRKYGSQNKKNTTISQSPTKTDI